MNRSGDIIRARERHYRSVEAWIRLYANALLDNAALTHNRPFRCDAMPDHEPDTNDDDEDGSPSFTEPEKSEESHRA